MVASIIVTDPKILRRIYLDEECFVPKYPKWSEVFVGSGCVMKIADHKSVHRLMAAPISGEALSNYVDYMEKEVVKCLEEWSSMREPIELLNEITSLYFKFIARIFLGTKVSGYSTQQLERLFSDMDLALLSIFLLICLDLLSTQHSRYTTLFFTALKALKEVEEILNKIIEDKRRALERNEGREELCQMEAMIEATDENGAKLLSNRAIIDMLICVFHGGNHTAGHAAMWVLIHISDHPHVFQKAKIINETLRRTTFVSQTFREAKANVNINGYIIRKGWSIPIWHRVVHMDPQIYSDPQKFDPSRWDNYIPKAGAFTPFGMGKLYCPGNELFKIETAILLHHFLLHYK
ncbi:unnamed protein product [Citrullus colocynthis]|uniref:Uncharacterized protein n=1 Tax=Citrullus colocynthis TaxID=252529 RepID=A0ABP0XNM2_9ROSI